jgi:hypothetical protein
MKELTAREIKVAEQRRVIKRFCQENAKVRKGYSSEERLNRLEHIVSNLLETLNNNIT